jgi:SAM-dependent methyltransferase
MVIGSSERETEGIVSDVNDSVRSLRTEIFSKHWPLDEEIRVTAATLPSHSFLANPSGQYLYVYLTRFVKALSEKHFDCTFSDLSVLDWGCGKGHVSKLIRDLGPKRLDSCDILSDRDDSAFGQEVPLIKGFGIQVRPLEHEYLLPYGTATFDVLLSVGVLEHVPDEQASLGEITRVLKPGGLFFCFFLPTKLSWTQQICRWLGDNYHDRLYTEDRVKGLLDVAGLDLLDMWYRQLLPKNSAHYPDFRLFERIDQFVTENTPLRYFATNIEFVSVKPRSRDQGASGHEGLSQEKTDGSRRSIRT